jgi:DNA-binding transcriptional ArsR family regulator
MPSVAVDLVFNALADATRRHILEVLANRGSASASDMAQEMTISRQAIAKHLRILEGAGLVSKARQGKALCYSVEPQQLAATGRWLQRFAARWEQH